MEVSAGLKTDDYADVAQAEHLNPITTELKQMLSVAANVHHQLVEMREREVRHRTTNESTNSWALTWSVVGLVLVVCLTAWQLYYVKNAVNTSVKDF